MVLSNGHSYFGNIWKTVRHHRLRCFRRRKNLYKAAKLIDLIAREGGGTATYYAACYDERIKIAVPTCAVSTYKGSIGDMWHCTCNYIPSIAKYFDMGELSALIAPRKLLVCNGEIDPIFPLSGTKEVYSIIEKIYKKEGVPENCQLKVYPNKPHYFDKEITFSALNQLRDK